MNVGFYIIHVKTVEIDFFFNTAYVNFISEDKRLYCSYDSKKAQAMPLSLAKAYVRISHTSALYDFAKEIH